MQSSQALSLQQANLTGTRKNIQQSYCVKPASALQSAEILDCLQTRHWKLIPKRMYIYKYMHGYIYGDGRI